jgi:hypothetical protein
MALDRQVSTTDGIYTLVDAVKAPARYARLNRSLAEAKWQQLKERDHAALLWPRSRRLAGRVDHAVGDCRFSPP